MQEQAPSRRTAALGAPIKREYNTLPGEITKIGQITSAQCIALR
jgi:hypothetical protein